MKMDLSIIAPIFNKEENIPILTNRIIDSLTNKIENYEIIYVNDGSNDNSKKVLDNLALTNTNIKIINFKKNCGQTAAIYAGFKIASGDLVLTMDADLQVDPEDLFKLLPYIKNYDMVNGLRANRQDNLIKKLSSKLANTARNWITTDNIQDTGCPLKLFKNEVVKDYYLFEGMHRFLPTLAKMNGYKVIEVEINHYPRKYGQSKYGLFNRLFKSFKDALAVRWMKKRMIKYEI